MPPENKFDPNMKFKMNEAINHITLVVDLLISGNLPSEAEYFNNRVSSKIMEMRKNFDFPSGNVVKVKTK